MGLRLIRHAAATALVALTALAVAACAATPMNAPISMNEPTSGTEQPVRVQTPHGGTVLDDGSGPELCLGIMLTSYPPQCGGPTLIGWDWSEWEGLYEEASGVRWGDFWVAGAYDRAANTFVVERAEPPLGHVWTAPDGDPLDFGSPCLEPPGGWHVVNPAMTNGETLENALAFAATLDGYAGAWLDQSRNPLHDSEPPAGDDDEARIQYELGMNDPELLVLNISTKADLIETQNALRERWGGMLCVSTAARTEGEMLAIQNSLADVPGLLSSWTEVTHGVVGLDVIFDDGTLQQRLDAEYGPGLVRVSSVLAPWYGD